MKWIATHLYRLAILGSLMAAVDSVHAWDNRSLTSINNPMVFWVNNNYDRLTPDPDDGVSYDDDIQTAPTTDANYIDPSSGQNAIPTIRDLEDYTTLNMPGLVGMIQNLPTNYTATFSWRNNTGAGIRIFRAADPNGGTTYLTNASVASAQTNYLLNPCYGTLLPNTTISLSDAFHSTTVPIPTGYFIFCGVIPGSDELVMQVRNPWGGVAGEASIFLNLKDIKQMYERWSVGEYPQSPINIATNCGDDGSPSFSYPYDPAVNATTPYILYVHGWNMPTWEKDRWAECAFKRLYWQGYRGRFGVFRWPTDYGFTGDFTQIITNQSEKDNFDGSENNAWQSGTGLLNTLNNLNAQYPGQVYVLAHSMGNIVAGEALRLAGNNQVVNTYVATQAAITAHTYDTTVTDFAFDITVFGIQINFGPRTPNIYGNWFAGNNGGGAGRVISFYNTSDYALAPLHWQLDQLFKPDQNVLLGGTLFNYGYNGSASDPPPWNNFYKEAVLAVGPTYFNIVTSLPNRYEVMAYAAQSYTTALGATPGVGQVAGNVNLITLWPSPDPLGNNYASHFYHSAEFRGDTAWEWNYWNTLLFSKTLGFNIANQ